MKLLKEMCAIHAPSGNEAGMTKFLLKYVDKNKKNWKFSCQTEKKTEGKTQNQ